MKQKEPRPHRILALAPCTKGFGYAVLEGTLVDWGVKNVGKDKNPDSLRKAEEMLQLYHPDVVVLENCQDTRRSDRIQTLTKELVVLIRARRIQVVLLSPPQIRNVFFDGGEGTKQDRAIVLAGHFPDELLSRLPSPRRAWMSEHYNMSVFDAVGLAWTFRSLNADKERGQ